MPVSVSSLRFFFSHLKINNVQTQKQKSRKRSWEAWTRWLGAIRSKRELYSTKWPSIVWAFENISKYKNPILSLLIFLFLEIHAYSVNRCREKSEKSFSRLVQNSIAEWGLERDEFGAGFRSFDVAIDWEPQTLFNLSQGGPLKDLKKGNQAPLLSIYFCVLMSLVFYSHSKRVFPGLQLLGIRIERKCRKRHQSSSTKLTFLFLDFGNFT